MSEKKKFLIISTTDYAVNMFLKETLYELKEDFNFYFSNNSIGDNYYGIGKFKRINFRRNPSPFFDLICLIKLIFLINKVKPDIIHSFAPKTGLLTALAGCFFSKPKVLHTFTGQVWATKKGTIRSIYKLANCEGS